MALAKRFRLQLGDNKFGKSKQTSFVKAGYFNLVYRAGAPIDQPKCAIVVSKKISKKAVVRNKIKRQLAQVFIKQMPKLKNGSQLKIITTYDISQFKIKEIEKQFEIALSKTNLLTQNYESGNN